MTDDRSRRCAVLGSPIGHSLSPVIHRAAYSQLGLSWEYTAHEVGEDGLAGFLDELDDRWRGLSLTMPLKRVAIELASRASDVAQTVGAANTLVRAHDGAWFADNTDVPGVVAALTERGVTSPRQVCVWGGGATAASVLTALAFMDAGPVHIHVRSRERARPVLAVACALDHPASPAAWMVGDECGAADLIVSTAPAGALDPLADQLSAASTTGRAVFDVVYDPWPTPLVAGWTAAGGVAVSGLDLLIHQAVGQLRLMTGHDVPAQVLRAAAEAELASRAGA